MKYIFGIFIILGLLIFGWLYNLYDEIKHDIDIVVNYTPKQSTQFFDKDGKLIANTFKEENREYVKYDDIPARIIEGLVAIEDTQFFEHHGINPDAISRAIIKDIQAGGFVEGASTLTQQLIKMLILTREKKLIRKVKEALLAIRLETVLTKEEILSLYLNKILPSDLANIVYGLAKEFRGERKIFGNLEKTNRMLLDKDNIIFILENRIRAHNLNNFNILFDVEHNYNITYFYGAFRIKNYIVLLMRNNKSITVGIHNPKNGTKIKSKKLDEIGEIKNLTGTSENIILNVKGKLFVLNPFSDEKLITVETEDIQYKSSLIRWEKGFYTFQSNTIYIFDTNKLIKKFTTDSYLTRVTTDGNIFYWNTTDYSTGDYLTIYDTTSHNENYKEFYQGTLSGSRKSFTVKNNKIFYVLIRF